MDTEGDGSSGGPLLDLAVAAGDLGTWRWDMAAGTVVWNRRMEEIFGFAPGEYDGTYESYAARLHPDEAQDMRDELDRAIAEVRRYELEHRVVRPDGSVRWIRGVGQVVADADGVPTGSVGCVADITELVLSTADRAGVLEKLTFLVKAGEMLSGSLDLEQTLRQIVELAVPRIADTAVLVVLEDGRPEVLAARHADPSREALLLELHERYPVQIDGPGMGRAMTTGQVQHLPEVPDALLREAALDEAHLTTLRRLGIGSGVAVPLIVGSRVVGALGLGLDRGRAVTEDMSHIAEALASRAAVALENARLHHVATSVADALQAGLAPRDLPSVRGLDVAARYVAAGEGVAVGGDFYDLVALPDEQWLLTVGDVCGRGPGAASMNAQVRFAARALARSGMSVVHVAEALNRDLLADTEDSTFCTAVLAHLRHVDGRTAVELVAAGHPPPVIIRADGTTSQLEATSPLLGALPGAVYQATVVDLAPGDLMVLFTDGVIEARNPSGDFFGEDRLLEVLGRSGRSAEECASAVEEAVTRFVGGPPADDLAVVAIRTG